MILIRILTPIALIGFLFLVAFKIMPDHLFNNNYLVDIAKEETKQVTLEQQHSTIRNENNNRSVNTLIFQIPIYLIIGGIMLVILRLANPQYIEDYFKLWQQKQLMQQQALNMLATKQHRMPSDSQNDAYMTIYTPKGHTTSKRH